MSLSAILAEECSKGDVAVRASVVLAVDAVSIKLVFSDASAEVSGDLSTLSITGKTRLGLRRVALGRRVSSSVISDQFRLLFYHFGNP